MAKKSRSKILITDDLSPIALNYLETQSDFGVYYDIEILPSEEKLIQIINNYDAVITRSGTPITDKLLSKSKNLKVIGRAGVGIDNVDIESATRNGVVVMNAPEGNITAATELTLTHILCCLRKFFPACLSLKEGKWARKLFTGREVNHKTIGIIGLGRIGSRVAYRLKSFNGNILAFDPYISNNRAEDLGVELVPLENLLLQSDIITVHTPLTPETNDMIGTEEIKKMKDGIILINCARGGIYNELALIEGLKSGKIGALGIDVFQNEPKFNTELLNFPNVSATPHIGANTQEAQENVGMEICQNVVSALTGMGFKNAVNLPYSSDEDIEGLEPYLQLSEKMGIFLASWASSHINQVTVEYQGQKIQSIKPLGAAFLAGILNPVTDQVVNWINGYSIAEQRGISIKEIRSSQVSPRFGDLISFTIETGKGTHQILGTLLGGTEPRLIEIDGYAMEASLNGPFIFLKNQDVPGVIGRVGSYLGDEKINIAEYRLCRKKGSHTALALIQTDSLPNPRQLKGLSKIENIMDVRLISM